MKDKLSNIWSVCDRFLDHDAASGVPTEERLSNAIETIKTIAAYAEKGETK